MISIILTYIYVQCLARKGKSWMVVVLKLFCACLSTSAPRLNARTPPNAETISNITDAPGPDAYANSISSMMKSLRRTDHGSDNSPRNNAFVLVTKRSSFNAPAKASEAVQSRLQEDCRAASPSLHHHEHICAGFPMKILHRLHGTLLWKRTSGK